jgi:hypothetical protein
MQCNPQRARFLIQSLLLPLFLASVTVSVGNDRVGSSSHVNQSALVLKDFADRVQEYVRLHKQQESALQPLKQTGEPAKIIEHQHLLASKIGAARANAVEGEIFTPTVRKVLLPIIRRHFRGAYAGPAHLTIQQGNPVKLHLHINETYPEGAPWTTVPPSLLQNLPRLPKEVEYRIVGQDLILWDVKANLVVDLFRQAIPWVS